MDFLGIGPLEFLFIIIIAILIFGPKDVVKAGQAVGRFLRKLVLTDSFQTVQKATRDLRNLPNALMREAGLEEMERELKQIVPPDLKGMTTEIDKSLKDEMKQIQAGMASWTTPPPSPKVKQKAEPDSESAPSTDKTTPIEQSEES
jgi:Sec-independent protein translocase protein TatA